MPERLQDIINVIAAEAYKPLEIKKPYIATDVPFEVPKVEMPLPTENILQKQIAETEGKKEDTTTRAFSGLYTPEEMLVSPYLKKYPYLTPEQVSAAMSMRRRGYSKRSIEKEYPIVATPGETLKKAVRGRLTEKARELKPEVEKRIEELAGKIAGEARLRPGAYERPAYLKGYRGELAGERARAQVEEWNKTVKENIGKIKELRTSVEEMFKSMTSPEAAGAVANAINMYFAYDVAKEIAEKTGADINVVYNALQRSVSGARDYLTELQKSFSSLLNTKIDLLSWMGEFIR
jgi:hypothetical protein